MGETHADERLTRLVQSVDTVVRRLERLEGKKLADRAWDIATRISVAIVLAIGTMIVTHEIRLSKIEGNRFTDKDASILERRILSALPPQWLREDVREIKDGILSLEARLRALEHKVK